MSDLGGGRPLRRPRQVTVAGGLALTGCILLIFHMLDSMAWVRSVDVRDSVDRFLSAPPGNNLGIEVDQVIAMLRGLVFVTGALAAVGGVLAVYVLRRHRPARIGLTVTAVLLVIVATTLSTPLLPLLVAVAATMLWGREARDWFEGRTAAGDRPAVPGGGTSASQPPGPPAGHQPADQPDDQPGDQPGHRPDRRPEPWQTPALPPWQPPQQASGQSPPRPGHRPPAPLWQQPGPYPPYSYGPAPERRPATVTVAAVLTWVFCGITTAVFSLLVLSLLVQQEQLVGTLQGDPSVATLGLTRAQIVASLWVLAAVGIFWSLSAIALAVLAFRRVNAARVVLVVSAALSGLVGIVAVPVGWLNAVAAFATVVLLLVGPSQRWFARRQPPTGPYGGHFAGPLEGPYQAPPPGWTPWQQQPDQDRQPAGRPDQPQDHQDPSGRPPVW